MSLLRPMDHQSASDYKGNPKLIRLWFKHNNLFTVCLQFRHNMLPLITLCKQGACFLQSLK